MVMGCIYVVGFGPGSVEHITARAREAIAESSAVIGYNTYVDLLASLVADKEIVRTGMTEEVSRAQRAVDLAMGGRTVAVISSGDAGLYGMAGLVYEVLMEHGWQPGDNPTVEVIPGISAIHSCAALLGAPIMHDACTISLSDHLTPWSVIEQRLEAAAAADFVIALYNPRSGRRTRQIVEAQRILLKYRRPDTPVGLVKSAYRSRQQVVRTTLSDMLNHEIGMLTTVIIGNQSTFYYGDLMITPRGYQRKYTLGEATQRLRPKDRLKPENEPWALPQALGKPIRIQGITLEAELRRRIHREPGLRRHWPSSNVARIRNRHCRARRLQKQFLPSPSLIHGPTRKLRFSRWPSVQGWRTRSFFRVNCWCLRTWPDRPVRLNTPPRTS
ncbi:hypothetical protein GCM10025857_01160 [Alicyclobacillus contaminans]|nr:hypothetical protein GCM10025857_01160 [Alicyclobacillus contaminans]